MIIVFDWSMRPAGLVDRSTASPNGAGRQSSLSSGTSAKNGREWSVWKASTNFHPMKFYEHVDTTYQKINYKLQLLTRQTTRDMAHTKPPNGSNSESRRGARTRENSYTPFFIAICRRLSFRLLLKCWRHKTNFYVTSGKDHMQY